MSLDDLHAMTDKELRTFAKTELNFHLGVDQTKEANIGLLCRHGQVDG